MSEEIKVVKKRGRPRKVAEVETIIVIDNSADVNPDIQAVKAKRINNRKTTARLATPEETTKTRSPRKTVTKVEADIERPKVTRTRRSAKSTEITSRLENVKVETAQSSQAVKSSILDQATVFQGDIRTELRVTQEDTPEPVTTPEADKSSRPVHQSADAVPISTHLSKQHSLDILRSNIDGLTGQIRSSAVQHAQISVSRLSDSLSRSADSVLRLKLTSARRIDRAAQLDKLHQRATEVDYTIRRSSSEVQEIVSSLEQQRHHHRISTFHAHFTTLSNDIDQTSNSITSIVATRHRRHAVDLIQAHTHTLASTISASARLVQQSASRQQQQQQQQQASRLSRARPSPSTPASMPSKLPPSSTSNPRLSLSPSSPNPNPNSNPATPTHQQQAAIDNLRRTPAYRQRSRQWTARIVGIPVLIVTSWVLYKSYQDTLRRRRQEDGVEGLRTRE